MLTTTAFAIIYMGFGLDFLERGILGRDVDPGKEPSRDRVVVAYRRLFAYGFAIAVVSGLAPLVFGQPFLTQTFVMLEGVPIYDHLEVASAIAVRLRGLLCGRRRPADDPLGGGGRMTADRASRRRSARCSLSEPSCSYSEI
ncbi:MnhB subunit of Na+/H+ antiporter-like protein [Natrinema hispanicum]|uniref:MnhB subunit of Na+/H+ antiporter-like protein n=1 Tax=Natrinema hispanicum TaxID=392421 RepID=A0A482YFR7_9EURY|nr:MnhB subunit of Na+/H+ antiporter-like protein [Natrinema hispanicum]